MQSLAWRHRKMSRCWCRYDDEDASGICTAKGAAETAYSENRHGTRITYCLKENQPGILEEHRPKGLVRNYGEFVSLPVGVYTERSREKEATELEDEKSENAEEKRAMPTARTCAVSSRCSLLGYMLCDVHAPYTFDYGASFVRLAPDGKRNEVRLHKRRASDTQNYLEFTPERMYVVKGIEEPGDLPLEVDRGMLKWNKSCAPLRSTSSRSIWIGRAASSTPSISRNSLQAKRRPSACRHGTGRGR